MYSEQFVEANEMQMDSKKGQVAKLEMQKH
jgi:hypothetical protein